MTPQTPQGAALSDADIDAVTDAQWGKGCAPNQYMAHRAAARAYIDADRRLTAEQGGADLRDTIREHLTSLYVCTRVWDAWRVGTMTEDDFIPAGETDFVEDLACAIEAAALTTQPQAEPRKDGSISFEEAQDLARRHAKAEPESYYSEPFEPHLWVINAIVEASATWYERAVQERVRRVKAEAATAQPQAEPADARIYWHASQGWQVEWLTHAPNGGQNNYYRRATPPSEAT